MPLHYKASGGSGDFKPIPSGSHMAVCDIVADIGLQPGSAQYPAAKQKVYIRFQIPAERMEYEKDGRKMDGPAVIGQFFTASMHEKATLRNRLEGWRGKMFSDEEAEAFDIAAIIGKPCLLNVTHNVVGDKTYANIASIAPPFKGAPIPKHEGDLLYYAPDDVRQYAMLPDWIRKKIDGQILNKPEPGEQKGNGPLPDGGWIDDSEIPF
jgi:hypothetical protein